MDIARGDRTRCLSQKLLLEGEHGTIGLRYHPAVEAEHEQRDADSHDEVRPRDPRERNAAAVQRYELKRLRKAGRPEDASQKKSKRRDEPDDVGDVTRVVDQEDVAGTGAAIVEVVHRSEEHTSELQTRGQLGCRLLLDKE